MDGLIGLLFWIAIVAKIVKAFKRDEKKSTKKSMQQYTTAGQRQMAQQRGQMQNRPVQKTTQAQRDAYYYNQQKATKERLQQKYAPQPKTTATANGNILERAKENVQTKAADAFVQQAHAEVCRDYNETSHRMPDVKVHKEESALCDTGEESDIIKRVNDLIITGYSGDMHFDRDFIAEGVEMLNRFTV